jgi:hypothetical protein
MMNNISDSFYILFSAWSYNPEKIYGKNALFWPTLICITVTIAYGLYMIYETVNWVAGDTARPRGNMTESEFGYLSNAFLTTT